MQVVKQLLGWNMSNAALNKFVTQELSSFMRDHGFTRKSLRFERVVGQVVDYVVVQGSRFGSGKFFIDVGLVFKELGKMPGMLVMGGVIVHLGGRLHDLSPRAPKEWRLTTTNQATTGKQLRKLFEPAITKLAAVDSAQTVLTTNLFGLDSGFTKQVRAQLKAVTGDKKGALADLALVAKEFASRGVTVEDQIKQLRLKRLLA